MYHHEFTNSIFFLFFILAQSNDLEISSCISSILPPLSLPLLCLQKLLASFSLRRTLVSSRTAPSASSVARSAVLLRRSPGRRATATAPSRLPSMRTCCLSMRRAAALRVVSVNLPCMQRADVTQLQREAGRHRLVNFSPLAV